MSESGASKKVVKKYSLADWVNYLSEVEMPVFAHTARNLAAVSSKSDTPVSQLSHLILQDSAMTMRVLRLANSVHFNPGGKPINTVSLAIMLLGFNEVRNIALSIAMIDTILRGVQHEHAVEEMARSLHAAVQSRAIAKARGFGEVEEVFIAALLYRLGHMCFWCYPRDMAHVLDAEYTTANSEPAAEQKVLGFTLAQLTDALNDDWRLSHLLAELFDDRARQTEHMEDIEQAYQLALAVEDGWGSLDTRNAVKSIAERAELSFTDTLEMVHQSAKLAAQTAIEYGAINAGKLINLPDAIKLELTEDGELKHGFAPDYQLQLAISRDLTVMLRDRVDLNTILGTVLEGVYRALGMDRTVLAFVSPDGKMLLAKSVYGKDSARLQNSFGFNIASERNIFQHIVSTKQGFWLNKKNTTQYESYLTTQVKKCLGMLNFFAMPLIIDNAVKGMIYADCKQSGRQLKEEDFQTFCHFCESANLALDRMSHQK